MPTLAPLLPIPRDDDAIRAALEDADLPPLLPAIAHLTGDLSVLRDDLRPAAGGSMVVQGDLSPAQQQATRDVAFDALVRWRDAGSVPAPGVADADLTRMIEFAVGEAVPAEYLGLVEEELEPDGRDLRAPAWTKDELDAERDFRVVVIGAGMSGLLCAYRLQQAGIEFMIVEKNVDVGGTWCENTYPGCRVDVPNHLYSYSFAQRADWPFRFAPQGVLLDYFRECATHFGLFEHIRFGTEVRAADYDETTERWHLVLQTPEGVESLDADAVVSAVGQLNRPHFPEIEGRESFAGPAFHSARWDESVDLRGKRVAVIGSAASALQLTPIVAEAASDLVVFQRTPNWCLPMPAYHEALPEGLRWLFERIPGYLQWYRATMFWRLAEGARPAARVDPGWEDEGRSVGEANHFVREILIDAMATELAGHDDVLAKSIPDYPPFAKRPLIDDGGWFRTLCRDDVHLVTEAITRITPEGVVTADGTTHEVDVVIYATGFLASDFLAPMRVTGVGGVDLHEWWTGSPRAYFGITIPHFPKLFCLYGPNTNIVANGSIIFFSECGVRYILDCLRLLLESHRSRLDLREQVLDAFSAEVDAENDRMSWGVASVNTWYKSRTGKVTQNWPFSLADYWRRTREVDPGDYLVT